MTKTIRVFLAILVISLGVIDMPADTITPHANSYASRNGYVMPGYMDYVVATWSIPCDDLMVVTGTGSQYSNNISIVFYEDNEQVGLSTVQFVPWSEINIFTNFTYDTVVFINPDNQTDSVIMPWCWWHY